MFGRSKRSVALLAGAAGFNLLLGVAVASGVVPGATPVSTSKDDAASAIEIPPTADLQASAGVAEIPMAEAPPESVPPTTAPTPTGPASTPAASEARQEAAAPAPIPVEEPESAPAETPAPAPVPSLAVPRLNPASFQVFQAIQQLALRIPLFKPSEAQARQFGDMVCTAFDQGSSYVDVRAGVLSAVGQVPGLSVSAADADYAIRTAVGLFCPGHKSKLP